MKIRQMMIEILFYYTFIIMIEKLIDRIPHRKIMADYRYNNLLKKYPQLGEKT